MIKLEITFSWLEALVWIKKKILYIFKSCIQEMAQVNHMNLKLINRIIMRMKYAIILNLIFGYII